MSNKLSNTIKNLLANFFGIGVLLFTQVILVPLYLYYWGVEIYSDWIILTAVSSIFSLSDIGLNTVTINRFVIKNEEKDFKECESLLTNNNILIFSVFIISLTGAYIYVSNFNIVSNLGLHTILKEEANYAFLMLIVYIFIGMGSAVLDAIYRAFSLNHKSVYIANCVRLTEGLIIVVSLVLKIPISYLTTFYLLPRVVAYIYKAVDTKKYFNYKFHLKTKNWRLFKEVFLSSLTFMFFPIGNGIVFQGFSLIVNKFFGAELLVLYNTTRTLTSFLNQLLGTVLQAVWPEFSIAYGKKDVARMRELHRKAFFTATSGALIISILLLLFGNLIFTTWTQGKVEFNYYLTLSFLIVLVFRSIWSTSSVTLMATNNHSTMGVLYVIFAILALCTALLSLQIYSSLILTVYCLLIIEVSLSIFALQQGLKITEDSFIELIRSLKFIYKQYVSKLIYTIPKKI
jgi:O-antigen/teichoic acid export membrane protein